MLSDRSLIPASIELNLTVVSESSALMDRTSGSTNSSSKALNWSMKLKTEIMKDAERDFNSWNNQNLRFVLPIKMLSNNLIDRDRIHSIGWFENSH